MGEAHKAAMTLLQRAASQLDQLIDANSTDIEGLARAEYMVDAIKKDINSLHTKIKKLMAESSPAYKFTIDGVGVYQRANAGGKNEWDDNATFRAIIRYYMLANCVDGETGEQIADPDLNEFVEMLREFARIEFRKTPFKDRNIDLEPLVETIGGSPSVRRLTAGEK